MCYNRGTSIHLEFKRLSSKTLTTPSSKYRKTMRDNGGQRICQFCFIPVSALWKSALSLLFVGKYRIPTLQYRYLCVYTTKVRFNDFSFYPFSKLLETKLSTSVRTYRNSQNVAGGRNTLERSASFLNFVNIWEKYPFFLSTDRQLKMLILEILFVDLKITVKKC